MTVPVIAARASVPVIGSWLSRWTCKQTPVGGGADLPQRGQIGQPFPDPEIAGVVDGGFGAQCSPFLVVLLDRGVLVVHVQAGGDPAVITRVRTGPGSCACGR